MIFLWIVLGAVLAFGIFYKFVFLRDLTNNIPAGNNLVAPCSGTVISIQTVTKDTPILIRKGFCGQIETELEANEPYYLVNIFMSPLDEHYTKMPCDGEVISIIQTRGKFLPVMKLTAAIQNEKQEFLLQTAIGRIKIIQIAGFLARRTRSFVTSGQKLKKGEKIGVILLGSQTALLFPKKNFTLQVKEGNKVRAGETIMCSLEAKNKE